MAAVVVSPAPPVHQFSWLPTVAHRAMVRYGKPHCLSRSLHCTLHAMKPVSSSVPQTLATKQKSSRFNSHRFRNLSQPATPRPILTHIEIRGLWPCIFWGRTWSGILSFTESSILTVEPSGLDLYRICGAQNLRIPRFTVHPITALARLSPPPLAVSLTLGRKGSLCRTSGPPYRPLGHLVWKRPPPNPDQPGLDQKHAAAAQAQLTESGRRDDRTRSSPSPTACFRRIDSAGLRRSLFPRSPCKSRAELFPQNCSRVKRSLGWHYVHPTSDS
jgi:hypothetical protein